jgi:drug/metabolite transporter (DMT)-like permease
MSPHSSAITQTPVAASAGREPSGLGWGLLGITAFSFTLPFTRIAADGGLSALFIGSGRAVVAALLASVALLVTRQAWPTGIQWLRLSVVAGGVVIGFPLLTSYALTTAPASHGALVIGLLPAATAVMAVVRCEERVPAAFWTFAALGAAAVALFAGLQNGGLGSWQWSDVLLFGAVLAAAVGYAEGGLLARELGAWQTVSWALLLSGPLMIVLTVVAIAEDAPEAAPRQWLAFAYLSAVSMYLGYFAWYRGLAIGPMASLSQAQLIQPVLSMLWAGLLLGEQLTWPTLLGGLVVIGCARAAVRARLDVRQTKGSQFTSLPGPTTMVRRRPSRNAPAARREP